jgi:hypothetical protein
MDGEEEESPGKKKGTQILQENLLPHADLLHYKVCCLFLQHLDHTKKSLIKRQTWNLSNILVYNPKISALEHLL